MITKLKKVDKLEKPGDWRWIPHEDRLNPELPVEMNCPQCGGSFFLCTHNHNIIVDSNRGEITLSPELTCPHHCGFKNKIFCGEVSRSCKHCQFELLPEDGDYCGACIVNGHSNERII